MIATEVRRGLIPEETAREDYGVVLEDGYVDETATADRRERIRAERPDSEQFDFGDLPAYVELAARIVEERREFNAKYSH